MPAPRKVFRIEQMAVRRLGAGADGEAPQHHAELMHELGALRSVLAAADRWSTGSPGAAADAGIASLSSENGNVAGATATSRRPYRRSHQVPPESMTRIVQELEAVVTSSERATQRVLEAAEDIDQLANNLSATLAGKIEQGLAQDILDQVIRIFESCNFQDLAGQRVTKVLATLRTIETHVARVLDEIRAAPDSALLDGAQTLQGPRLHFDRGHISQSDIDAMFGDH